MPKKTIKKLKAESLVQCKNGILKNARIAFLGTLDSSQRFYEIYQLLRKGTKGTTTDQQQDLLRAMLVFACSGLDAIIKQLIKDALERVIIKDKGSQQEFQKFVERKLKKESVDFNEEKLVFNAKFLASVIINDNPKEELIGRLKYDLTSDSLQSKDQLLKIAAYFAITKDSLFNDEDTTKKALDARNEIIHEMDINFNIARQKNKKQRKVEEMVKFTENILRVATTFITIINNKV